MKQKLLALLIMLIVTGCAGTPTAIVIPKVDSEGYLKQVDDRLVYNDWPLSLILPSSWPVEGFTGEVLADSATNSTFVRDPLPGRALLLPDIRWLFKDSGRSIFPRS